MTEFKILLSKAEMTAYGFAKMTGQPIRTVYDWASGRSKCPPAVVWGLNIFIFMNDLTAHREKMKQKIGFGLICASGETEFYKDDI